MRVVCSVKAGSQHNASDAICTRKSKERISMCCYNIADRQDA